MAKHVNKQCSTDVLAVEETIWRRHRDWRVHEGISRQVRARVPGEVDPLRWLVATAAHERVIETVGRL